MTMGFPQFLVTATSKERFIMKMKTEFLLVNIGIIPTFLTLPSNFNDTTFDNTAVYQYGLYLTAYMRNGINLTPDVRNIIHWLILFCSNIIMKYTEGYGGVICIVNSVENKYWIIQSSVVLWGSCRWQ